MDAESPDNPGRGASAVQPQPGRFDSTTADPFDAPLPGTSSGADVLRAAWRIAAAGSSLILLAAVTTALAAFAFSATRADEYRASASLLFNADAVLGTATDNGDPTRQAANDEALLALPVVAERASVLMRGQATPAEVKRAVSIVSTPNTDVVEIHATSTDPARSARMANAYGEAFIAFRLAQAQFAIRDALARARRTQAGLSATDRANGTGEALRERIANLEKAQAAPTSEARLVQRATPPSSPSSPRPARTAVLGAVLGAALGFALAAIVDHRAGAVRARRRWAELQAPSR